MSDQDRTIPERPTADTYCTCPGRNGYSSDCAAHAPRTIPERLDAAKPGAEFGAVIQDLFKALEKARDDEDDDEQRLGHRTW